MGGGCGCSQQQSFSFLPNATAMNLRHIEDNSAQRTRLSDAIGRQLKQIFAEAGNVVPEELVEYIVVLLVHGKAKNEVAQTLVDFLHDRAQPFAEWLFEYVQEHWEELVPVPVNKGVEKSKSKRTWDGMCDMSQEKVDKQGEKKEEGCRLKSAISIPEGGLELEERKPSQGPAKRSRRFSPVAWEEPHIGGEESRGGSYRRRSGTDVRFKERDAGDWEDKQYNKSAHGQEANRRIFANALGAVSAQFEPSRPRVLMRDWGDEASGGKAKEEQKSTRGRSVFDRLGKSNMVVEDCLRNDAGMRKGKQSVFERLESGSNVMNMEVRMDLQTRETKDNKEPAATSSTITFTVNHSTQGQSIREPQEQNLMTGQVGVPTHGGPKPATLLKEPGVEKQSEVQSLRDKVARMESEVEELRAKSQSTVSKAEISAFSARQETDRRSVCVQNVHFMANPEVVGAHFSVCGGVRGVVFPTGPFSTPKGYCFVEFASPDCVEKAMELGGTLLMGRMIKVIRKITPPPGAVQQAPSPGFGIPGGFPGRGFKAMRPPFGRLPWGARGGRYALGRASHKIVRSGSETIQEATSTAAQPSLDSNTVVDIVPEDVTTPGKDIQIGDISIKDDDFDFEIDTGAQDDDIRAVIDGGAS